VSTKAVAGRQLRRAYTWLFAGFTLGAISAGIDVATDGKPLDRPLNIILLIIAVMLLACANVFVVLLLRLPKNENSGQPSQGSAES
jgi:hypothetical protein